MPDSQVLRGVVTVEICEMLSRSSTPQAVRCEILKAIQTCPWKLLWRRHQNLVEHLQAGSKTASWGRFSLNADHKAAVKTAGKARHPGIAKHRVKKEPEIAESSVEKSAVAGPSWSRAHGATIADVAWTRERVRQLTAEQSGMILTFGERRLRR